MMLDDYEAALDDHLTDSEYVRRFIPIVPFLGEVLGKTSEVVLHDVARLDASVIAIANGENSGRTIGAPATDLVLRMLRDGRAHTDDYVTGYRASADGGGKFFRSATYFFRRHGRVVAMLCINTDDSLLEQLIGLAGKIGESHLPGITTELEDSQWQENLATSAEEIAVTATQREIERRGVPLGDFTPADRQEVVAALENEGIFRLKGAVADVADALEVSVPTVYRCLRAARRPK